MRDTPDLGPVRKRDLGRGARGAVLRLEPCRLRLPHEPGAVNHRLRVILALRLKEHSPVRSKLREVQVQDDQQPREHELARLLDEQQRAIQPGRGSVAQVRLVNRKRLDCVLGVVLVERLDRLLYPGERIASVQAVQGVEGWGAYGWPPFLASSTASASRRVVSSSTFSSPRCATTRRSISSSRRLASSASLACL